MSRRRAPWVLVEMDGSAEAHRALVWAFREAARREAVVRGGQRPRRTRR